MTPSAREITLRNLRRWREELRAARKVAALQRHRPGQHLVQEIETLLDEARVVVLPAPEVAATYLSIRRGLAAEVGLAWSASKHQPEVQVPRPGQARHHLNMHAELAGYDALTQLCDITVANQGWSDPARLEQSRERGRRAAARVREWGMDPDRLEADLAAMDRGELWSDLYAAQVRHTAHLRLTQSAPFETLLLVYASPLALPEKDGLALTALPHPIVRQGSTTSVQDPFPRSQAVTDASQRATLGQSELRVAWFSTLIHLRPGAQQMHHLVAISEKRGPNVDAQVVRGWDIVTSLWRGLWGCTHHQTPELVAVLLHQLADLNTITVESGRTQDRTPGRKATKKWKPRPTDYYEVSLARRVQIGQEPGQPDPEGEGEERESGPRAPAHRHDVRGHRRVRVQRGPLPLDPKQERLLRRRGYRVYTDGEPIGDDDRVLLFDRQASVPSYQRGKEWLAVLDYWIDPHQRGTGEYIPATRRVKTLED